MPATKTAKGLKVCCPFCLSDESVTLDLNDVTKVSCGSCSEDFTVDEAIEKVTEMLTRWEAVQTWIGAAPVD